MPPAIISTPTPATTSKAAAPVPVDIGALITDETQDDIEMDTTINATVEEESEGELVIDEAKANKSVSSKRKSGPEKEAVIFLTVNVYSYNHLIELIFR